MKEWLTAREIAEAGLPDMPTTKRGVNKVADEAGWNDHPSFARRRSAVGGGMEYHYRLLPTLAQIAYFERHTQIDAVESASVQTEPTTEPLSARASIERDARLAILAAFDNFSRHLRSASRLKVFCDKYNADKISVEVWVRALVPTISPRSLTRWQSEKRRGRIDALAVDRGAARKGTGVLDTANGGRVRQWMLALVAQQPFLSAKRVRDLCRHEFGDTIETAKGQVAMPPVRTFQHTLKALKAENKVVLTKLTNPDKYRSIMAPSGSGTLRHITQPNQLWQIDASPVDALCVDGRHSLYACIDIATRRLVITVSKTPRASAVMLMIRKAVLAWGVPDVIKTDNGSDFVAQDTKRLLNALNIEIDLSDAYAPEQKAHVERVIKTFQHDCGPLLPGFIGHSVADRKAIESRKSFAKQREEAEAETFGVSLTAAELQRHIDEWVELLYHNQAHSGLKGKSPAQAALEATAVPRTVNERALDVLLMPVAGGNGQRTVTKFGVRIGGYHYQSAQLLPGEQVFVRLDPMDMGKAYAFDQAGAVFKSEVICPELAGIHPATFIKAVKEQRAEMLDDMSRTLKRDMRTMTKGPAMIEKVLEVARRDAPNVIAMPRRSTEHTTPQIAAANDARSDKPKDHSKPLDALTAAEQQRLIAEFDVEEDAARQQRIAAKVDERLAEHEAARTAHIPADSNVTALPETEKQRYRRAHLLRREVDAGREVDLRDAIWLGRYETTAEFRGQKAVHDEYGDAYLGL